MKNGKILCDKCKKKSVCKHVYKYIEFLEDVSKIIKEDIHSITTNCREVDFK